MADRTSTSTVLIVSMFNAKHILVSTPAATATGDTIDVGNVNLGGLNTILHISGVDVDGTAVVATWSGTVITFGTLTTGVHQVSVIGTT